MGLDADWLHGGGNSTGEEGECSTPGAGGIEEGWGLQGWCKGKEHLIEGNVGFSKNGSVWMVKTLVRDSA